MMAKNDGIKVVLMGLPIRSSAWIERASVLGSGMGRNRDRIFGLVANSTLTPQCEKKI